MKICVCIGTRPEAIKLAPVIRAIRKISGNRCLVHLTGQHPDLAAQALAQFDITPDSFGTLSDTAPDLNARFGAVLSQVESLACQYNPDWFVVHGDTATAAAAALGSFHTKISVAHVEAGLRTGNLDGPWPEEGYRSMIARFARLHFASTISAKDNLLDEGIPRNEIIVTGNTVVDALLHTVERLRYDRRLYAELESWYATKQMPMKMILVTLHRRENHGTGILGICEALRNLARRFSDIGFILPIHPNPAVRGPVLAALGNSKNIKLINPVDYTKFVFLMQKSDLILTDSGGIQEEAPSLRRPVLVMRNETERPEAVEAGFARLTGSDNLCIEQSVADALNGKFMLPRVTNPFGDGKSALRIANALHTTALGLQGVIDKSRASGRSHNNSVISCNAGLHV